MNRPSGTRKHKRRSDRGGDGMQELKVAVPVGLVAALDEYARTQGVSRAEAVRLALCCGPLVEGLMSSGGVPSRDVLGP